MKNIVIVAELTRISRILSTMGFTCGGSREAIDRLDKLVNKLVEEETVDLTGGTADDTR